MSNLSIVVKCHLVGLTLQLLAYVSLDSSFKVSCVESLGEKEMKEKEKKRVSTCQASFEPLNWAHHDPPDPLETAECCAHPAKEKKYLSRLLSRSRSVSTCFSSRGIVGMFPFNVGLFPWFLTSSPLPRQKE